MAIIVNGSSDPTSINFNGVSLSSVYARQGPSGQYVQVWPSQFTLDMTGECPEFCVYSSSGLYCQSLSRMAWVAWDTSDYTLTATGLPTTVTSWGASDIIWAPYKICACLETEDEYGCEITGWKCLELPKDIFSKCENTYCPTGTNFNLMFPNNFTGFHAENLCDRLSGVGWLNTIVCPYINEDMRLYYGVFSGWVQRNCEYCGTLYSCYSARYYKCVLNYSEGSNWYRGYACVWIDFTDCIKWKLQANLANGQVYKSEDYITRGQKHYVMKPV